MQTSPNNYSPSPVRKYKKLETFNFMTPSATSNSNESTAGSACSTYQSVNKSGSIGELIEPLNLLNMSSLGEPDPTAIARHDLLSAISFDKTGQMLSVGDRGGRIIIFEKASNVKG